jgi:hypothetical protein
VPPWIVERVPLLLELGATPDGAQKAACCRGHS